MLSLTVALSLFCGRGVGRRKRAYREPTAIVELGAAGECDFPKRQVRANGGGRIHSNQRLARNRGRRLRPCSGSGQEGSTRPEAAPACERNTKSPFVFTSERGTPFTRRGFQAMVERAGKAIGFDVKIHPHMLPRLRVQTGE